MVREEDAAALVVYAAEKLALAGHQPRITHENGPRLVRLGALMLDAFGVGRETEEDDDRLRELRRADPAYRGGRPD